MRVIPNGADATVFSLSAGRHEREGVVMAARIEPFKNQLRLIRACRDVGLPLTLVGPTHPHHGRYAEACRRAADASVTFIDTLPQTDLANVFQTAKVHALPSWFETAGLASLEAGLSGCAIVTTDRGFAREYFGDLAVYCDPGSIKAIASAVQQASEKPVSAELRDLVKQRFSWTKAAEHSVIAYRELLRT
jgi:glycosyltransferase involved in cell wall biosynthesis